MVYCIGLENRSWGNLAVGSNPTLSATIKRENMTILDTIKTKQLEARRAKNQRSLNIFSTLFSEVEKVGKDKANRATTDEEAVAIIKKFILNASECLDATRDTVAATSLSDEIKVYETFLPQQLSYTEIKEIFDTLEDKGVPSVMKHFKANFAGRYDGKVVSNIAKGL